MKLIVANWKAYVTSAAEAKALADATAKAKAKKDAKVVLCPPFVFLPLLKKSPKFSLGAQDVFWKPHGPYTGEVTTDMLERLLVKYVIVGHSERRNHLGETDEMVQGKVAAARAAGREVILCVGEKTRDDPKSIPSLVAAQVKYALEGLPKSDVEHVIVAYEPVWAIGTGIPDNPDDALSAALYIRKVVSGMYDAKTARALKVLYGGSVDARNVASFVNQEGIDGVLIGKASTNKREFAEILKAL